MVPSGTVSRERSSAAIDMKNNKRVTFSVSGPILTKSNMEPHPPALETDPTRVSVLSSSVRQHDKSTDPDEEEEDSEGKVKVLLYFQHVPIYLPNRAMS